jgi:hypothetical protein
MTTDTSKAKKFVLLKSYEKIKYAAGWIVSVMAAGTVIYTAYVYFSDRIIEQERKLQYEKQLIISINKLRESDSLTVLKINQMIDTLNTVSKKLNATIRFQKILSISYLDHLKVAFKSDELIKYYELQTILKR